MTPGCSAVSPPSSAAADLDARCVDARHELGDALGVDEPDREVVQEEERLGSRADEVVDAHRHEVVADRRVDARLPGDLELGADAVGRRHEHRVAPAALAQREAPGEPADRAEDAGAVRGAEPCGDPRDRGLAGGDVDSCVGVGRGWATRHAPTPVAPRTSRGTRVGYRPVRHASQNPAAGASIASTRCSKEM